MAKEISPEDLMRQRNFAGAIDALESSELAAEAYSPLKLRLLLGYCYFLLATQEEEEAVETTGAIARLYKKAEESLEQARRIDPAAIEPRLGLCRVFWRQGRALAADDLMSEVQLKDLETNADILLAHSAMMYKGAAAGLVGDWISARDFFAAAWHHKEKHGITSPDFTLLHYLRRLGVGLPRDVAALLMRIAGSNSTFSDAILAAQRRME
jgi:tetratricopeptide (TPR) repeat protein